jgi:hypothetical protein
MSECAPAGGALMPVGPVLLASLFEEPALAEFTRQLAAQQLVPVADAFLGSYGISRADAQVIAPVGQYAPIFAVQPQTSAAARANRHLSPDETAAVDPTFSGPVPQDPRLPVLPPADERNWGIELGRRFRDALRHARTSGITIAPGSWQFDEVLGECRFPAEPNRWRRFIGGVLHGIAFGRPELLEPHERGFVWVAWTALKALPTLPITAELQLFWQDLNAATRFLVGEEYTDFVSDPVQRGHLYARPHIALGNAGQIRKGLAQRYIVGTTPGWRVGGGLGGNVGGQALPWVTSWRNRFLDGRIAAKAPAGYAQFYFARENATPEHITSAFGSLAHAVRSHPVV